jgi:phosphatidylglycerophosphate synthase
MWKRNAIESHLTVVHAWMMLAGLVLSIAWHDGLPLAVTATASCCVYLVANREFFPRFSDFGLGNAVTTFRFVLTVGLVLEAPMHAGPALACFAAVILLLDAVDGALARRARKCTPFGARFDMEADAFLVLAASFVVFHAGHMGPLVLAGGALRYAYVAFLGLVGRSEVEAPRSDFARVVFVIYVLSLVVALWPLAPWHRPLMWLSTLLLVASFTRSLVWSMRGKPSKDASAPPARDANRGDRDQWSWSSGTAVAKRAKSGNMAHSSSSITK